MRKSAVSIAVSVALIHQQKSWSVADSIEMVRPSLQDVEDANKHCGKYASNVNPIGNTPKCCVVSMPRRQGKNTIHIMWMRLRGMA